MLFLLILIQDALVGIYGQVLYAYLKINEPFKLSEEPY